MMNELYKVLREIAIMDGLMPVEPISHEDMWGVPGDELTAGMVPAGGRLEEDSAIYSEIDRLRPGRLAAG